MTDPQLGLSLVFNGCIYNYKALRKELEGKGYQFFSDGDTEVILKAYHYWKEAFVEHLNGMFAIIIHERDTGRVIAARDRLGIKPLYYAPMKSGIRLASSLPALLASGGISTELDPIALHHYLSFHSIVPAPMTVLQGVRKLPPAHLMTIERSQAVRIEPYWFPTYETKPEEKNFGLKEWKKAVLDKLRESVSRRMTADVDVGVLLSGGLDSSLVVGLLSEMGQKNLHTFSIGFESVDSEEGDEFKYSDIIANTFKTQHHQIFIDSKRALENLDRCIQSMSEPMVSHDAIGFYLLSEEVSKSIKVVQSGQGADEIFGGYHWYPPLLDSKEGLSAYQKVFFDRDHQEIKETLSDPWIEADYSADFVRDHFMLPGAERLIDKALRIDSLVMLVDDPVKRVDNMTMAWGLEARVPFLDHEVVELAARIPAELKVSQGGKYVLKEAAREIIPNEVIDRPKGYFPVPALKYLRGSYLEKVKTSLLNETAKKRSLFKAPALEKLLKDPESHITPLQSSKLWQLSLLEQWLQSNKI